MKTWFSDRRTRLQTQLATVSAPFATGSSVAVTNGTAVITGTAPITAGTISIDGVPWPVTWNSVTGWTAVVSLKPGTNAFTIGAVDVHGNPIDGATNTVAVVYSNSVPSAIGAVVLNEIMFNPALPDANFVELFNTSTNCAFDLSGWELNGLSYAFPSGALIGPRSYLLLAKDRTAFDMAYGSTLAVFDVFDGNLQSDGETLTLLQPGATNLVVDRVRYETNAPWPAATLGCSLQVVDPAQDNSRVANWAIGRTIAARSTPGLLNSINTNLPPFPPLWLNELQAQNVSGPTDNAGDRDPWIELFNAGPRHRKPRRVLPGHQLRDPGALALPELRHHCPRPVPGRLGGRPNAADHRLRVPCVVPAQRRHRDGPRCPVS